VSATRPAIKVLYTSGYTDEMLAEDDVVQPGDFLQKPFTPSDLARRIRRLLD
jgi:two-component SAPR family response regulator